MHIANSFLYSVFGEQIYEEGFFFFFVHCVLPNYVGVSIHEKKVNCDPQNPISVCLDV